MHFLLSAFFGLHQLLTRKDMFLDLLQGFLTLPANFARQVFGVG